MQPIFSRLPDAEFFQRNGPRIVGFLAGATFTLLIGLLFSVIYTGYGIGTEPPSPEVVYPNF